MLTDPVADMLARLKNANKALLDTVEMPASGLKKEIARLLRDEGYIKDYRVEKGESFDTLVIELKFGPKRERIITDVRFSVYLRRTTRRLPAGPVVPSTVSKDSM